MTDEIEPPLRRLGGRSRESRELYARKFPGPARTERPLPPLSRQIASSLPPNRRGRCAGSWRRDRLSLCLQVATNSNDLDDRASTVAGTAPKKIALSERAVTPITRSA